MSEVAKRKVSIFIYAALILSTLLVFLQVRNFDFTGYDDNSYIYENPHVLKGITADSIIWAFTTSHTGYWHPLTWLSLMLDCQIFGAKPGPIHLVNVAFHIINTLLLFAIFSRMTARIWPSAFVAAAFALHPMHVESVAWIAERKDVLSTLFFLLTLFAYVNYVRRRGLFRYLLTLLLFVFGILAKPMIVILPFVLLLLDYWPLNRFTAEHAETAEKNNKINSACSAVSAVRLPVWLIVEKIPFFVFAAVLGVITFLAQRNVGTVASIDILPLQDRLSNVFLSYARYIGKFFVPQNLAVFYPSDIHIIKPWQVAMCILLFIAITILVILFGRSRRYLPVGWFWFVGTLVPVIGLVQVGAQAYADRYTYIPYIGLFIMIGWGLPDFLSKWPQRKIILGPAMIIVLATLGILAHQQVGFWKNSITLFSRAIEVTQNNVVAYDELGNAYVRLGRYQDAIESYKRSIKIKPDYAESHYNLGVSYLKIGKYQDALESCRQAVKIKPDYAEAYNGLGTVYLNIGRFQDALESYRQAVKVKPDYTEAHYNLGVVCDKLGRWQDSIEAYKQAIKIKSDFAGAYNNLGVAYLNIGSFQEALESCRQAINIEPDFAEAYNNLGNACLRLGRYQEAIETYQRVLKIKPDYTQAHYNLGVAYGGIGNSREEIESYKRAIRIKPDFADAHYNLCVTYLTIGDKASALEEYKILKSLGAKQADQLYNLIYK
jgi:tetratricopeptide (TPR) repeat protein